MSSASGSSSAQSRHDAEDAKQDAKDAKAAAAAVLAKVYHVEYLVRGPAIPKEKRTHFTGPDPVTHGVAVVLVEDPLQIKGVLEKHFGHGEGETLEITTTRVLAENVLTAATKAG
jgi:hypothetical protein